MKCFIDGGFLVSGEASANLTNPSGESVSVSRTWIKCLICLLSTYYMPGFLLAWGREPSNETKSCCLWGLQPSGSPREAAIRSFPFTHVASPSEASAFLPHPLEPGLAWDGLGTGHGSRVPVPAARLACERTPVPTALFWRLSRPAGSPGCSAGRGPPAGAQAGGRRVEPGPAKSPEERSSHFTAAVGETQSGADGRTNRRVLEALTFRVSVQ